MVFSGFQMVIVFDVFISGVVRARERDPARPGATATADIVNGMITCAIVCV